MEGGAILNGTGTQTDPFQVTTANEFITAVGTSGAYVDILNNIDFQGITQKINIYCKSLNGNQKILTNLYVQNSSIFYIYQSGTIFNNVTIECLVILEGVQTGSVVTGIVKTSFVCSGASNSATYSLTFKNCDLRIKYYNNYNQTNGNTIYYIAVLNYAIQSTFYNCVLSIDLYNINVSPIRVTNNFNLHESVVKINIYEPYEWTKQVSTSTTNGYLLYTGSSNIIENSAIFANYTSNKDVREKTSIPFLVGYSSAVPIYNSYFVCKCLGKIILPYTFFGLNFKNTSFYDKSVSQYNFQSLSATYSVDKQFYGLTTEECKDEQKLLEIGFLLKDKSDGRWDFE